MPIWFKHPRLAVLVTMAGVGLLFGGVVNPAHAQGVFGGGGNVGSIFDGIRRGVSDIFDSLGVGVPGGAVIPGIETPPEGGPPVLPGDGLPPLDDPSKKIKVTLEWDAVSIGGEAVDPEREDPLKTEHIDWINKFGCPPCEIRAEEASEHTSEDWHYCAIQPGCMASQVQPSLYGWCGHQPTVIGPNVPGDVQQAYEGPNTYTLPSAVSNKYVRRDGYSYMCVRTCDGGYCEQPNYLEFQTMVYHSNAVSMYVRVENLSDLAIENVLVRVNELSYDGERRPLPHNVDYPVSGSGFRSEYEHGHELGSFTDVLNGTLAQVKDSQLVLGPLRLAGHESRYIPLQLKSSEVDEVPSGLAYAEETRTLATGSRDTGFGVDLQPFTTLVGVWGQLTDTLERLTKTKRVTPSTAYAQGVEDWCSCVGEPLADYMNTVVDGFTCGGASLSSPVFNLSAPSAGCIQQAIADAGGNFGGNGVETIMGNAYNLCDGRTITDQLDILIAENPGKNIYLTEIGAINIEQGCVDRNTGIQQLKAEMDKIRTDPKYQGVVTGAALFNSFGYNPDFGYNIFSNDELIALTEGDPIFGINTARPVGSTDPYGQAAGLGMGSVVEIVAIDQLDATVAAFQAAQANGLTPILRIGIGNNAGGFDDPQDYVEFLNALAAALGNCGFTAIAGPNEPSLEPWASNTCGTVTGDFVGMPGDPYTPGSWEGEFLPTLPGGEYNPGDPIDPNELQKPLGKGGIVPRDFDFICSGDSGLDGDDERCDGRSLPNYIVPQGEKLEKYRDTTGIGGCGYWASSNNSVIGPLEIVAEYGGESPDEPLSRSVLLASIPIGGRIIDDQARPYGWPVQGEIEQNWGFTGEAAGQGSYRSNPSREYGEFRFCEAP